MTNTKNIQEAGIILRTITVSGSFTGPITFNFDLKREEERRMNLIANRGLPTVDTTNG